MAGLNSIISNTAQQTTTLPTWFDTAQQNVVNQAGAAMNAAPAPQNTVAQQAVNQLSGPTNAFTNAAGTLQNIAGGAANPWITDASGNVSPNTNTAMGGLFQAQNQQLQQLMPNITAQPNASAIGSGQFGSLRGQTAENKAIGDAIAQQNTAQYQAALQNQATGVNAAQGVGNVTQQDINNLLITGQYQQAAPFTNVSNYGKVLGGIQAPTTVSNQTQLSPLNQIGGLVTALGGGSSSGILGTLFGTPASSNTAATKGLLTGLGDWASGLFNSSSGTSGAATTDAQAAANAAQVQANLPSNVNMDQYNAAINGWTQSGTDSSGQPTYVDSTGAPV
jgi:hypothetical protein